MPEEEVDIDAVAEEDEEMEEVEEADENEI